MPVHECQTKADYDYQLEQAGNKLVVVDFTASWCGPCQMIKPKFIEFSNSEEYTDVVFLKVDVDENSETASHCGIQCMPTFFFIKNKEKVDEMAGAKADDLKKKIDKNM